jgi:hypothetical protein
MGRTAGYIWTDCKTNTQTTKKLKITPTVDKLLEYKRNWIQHVKRMHRNRLPRVMKHCCLTGKRNHGRPLKRLLDTWDRNGSTSGPTSCQIYDDEVHCLSCPFQLIKPTNNFLHTDFEILRAAPPRNPFCWDVNQCHWAVAFRRSVLISLIWADNITIYMRERPTICTFISLINSN